MRLFFALAFVAGCGGEAGGGEAGGGEAECLP